VSYPVKDSKQAIISNLDALKTEINQFPRSSILPVTKRKSIETIKVAIDWGMKKVGENYIQEAIPKIEAIKRLYPENDVQWHFLGSLQSNKVKKAVHYFNVIETVSREKIFHKIVNQAKLMAKPVKVFIEINASAEEHKSGLFYRDIETFLDNVEVNSPENYHPVRIGGFMTIGRFSLSRQEKRLEYKEFVTKIIELRKKYPLIGKELSFGMSNDYKIALEEGSTQIRLGTLLFGSRE